MPQLSGIAQGPLALGPLLRWLQTSPPSASRLSQPLSPSSFPSRPRLGVPSGMTLLELSPSQCSLEPQRPLLRANTNTSFRGRDVGLQGYHQASGHQCWFHLDHLEVIIPSNHQGFWLGHTDHFKISGWFRIPQRTAHQDCFSLPNAVLGEPVKDREASNLPGAPRVVILGG